MLSAPRVVVIDSEVIQRVLGKGNKIVAGTIVIVHTRVQAPCHQKELVDLVLQIAISFSRP